MRDMIPNVQLTQLSHLYPLSNTSDNFQEDSAISPTELLRLKSGQEMMSELIPIITCLHYKLR